MGKYIYIQSQTILGQSIRDTLIISKINAAEWNIPRT